ncbi:WD40-repeat-containing domain protein [Suillus subaureus]|uniref:WD40-repeat-containing domain protein n=1 Tax=Suillus subaureus TaxID=48587 RepID=A0A9P7DUB4_9AGAM|nr:WD40-repeat-containing domain protein [Suillus subaureus]KAG1803345.1 WD40-repeat-containing domain protein [Suillus subaureus]
MVGDPWEGHHDQVKCLDWSPNALEIASGSEDAPPIETSHGWVNAVKYSPRCDKLMSGGVDKMISVWSKDGQLLMKIKGHEDVVTSLCWSKDGAHIFSSSCDHTIRKWRSIDGEELIVLPGHTNAVRSICLSPNKIYLLSTSSDYTVRIWDLKTNQQVGDPLWHDDELFAVVMSPDGKYIASAGKDAKIYIWSVEAALKQQGGVDDAKAKPDAKFKRRPIQPRDNFASRPIIAKQFANNRGVGRYGNDFFGSDINRVPAPPAGPSSLLRSLFGYISVGTRSPNSLQSMPREPRHWNFNLFPVWISRRTVFVSPARDEDRYGITPESDAEAAAAMQRTGGNETNSSAQQAQPAAGIQGSEGLPTERQGSSGGTEEVFYEVSCCGFYIGRRPTSHRS